MELPNEIETLEQAKEYLRNIKTLDESKAFLRKNFDENKAVGCECCGQLVKQYKRKLNTSMAAILIAVYQNAGRNEIHVNKLLVKLPKLHSYLGGGDFTKLAHWNLIASVGGNRADGCKHNGHWRITERGEQFVKQQILVPSHVYLYNGKFQGYSQESTSILKALGKKFNYNELMRGD